MAENAVTLGAQRIFAGNVAVNWTPSQKSAAVTVLVTIGGAAAWEFTFEPDSTTAPVKAKGDTWNLEGGTFTVKYGPDSKTGQLKAHDWKYSVEEEPHQFDGNIGSW
jgi:hypothetical protein